VLHNFTGHPDGRDPSASLILDSQRNLYGTTVHGGDFSQGAVFMVALHQPQANQTTRVGKGGLIF